MQMDKTELAIELSGAELISEVRLDGSCFIRRKNAVIDQNFADLAVEKGIVDALPDVACAGYAVQSRVLVALAERQQAIDVERVGRAIVDCARDGEILSDGDRPGVHRLISRLGRAKAKRNIGLVGSHIGISP